MVNMTHIAGSRKKDIKLYALSTCGWCKKTRLLLEELDLDYHYIYVDLLKDLDKAEARGELEKWNPHCSFPTVVIQGSRCIVGFDEEKIRKELSD